jgi:hypothetical protein
MRVLLVLTAGLFLAAPGPQAQSPPDTSRYVTAGLFIGSPEEGARMFTPTRLLPFGHPEALEHQFPTVQQFHRNEDSVLLVIGRAAGLRLAATLERYPTRPDSVWPYAPFQPPPLASIQFAPVITRDATQAPVPGLRVVAFVDRFPVSFIVDTRGMSLVARHMTRATTMGLDMTRADFLRGLSAAGQDAPERGAVVIVYRR